MVVVAVENESDRASMEAAGGILRDTPMDFLYGKLSTAMIQIELPFCHFFDKDSESVRATGVP